MRLITALLLAAISCSAQNPSALAARKWRQTHERSILAEFVRLLSIPNIATDTPNIRRNAALIIQMYEKRGVPMRLLETEGAPPVVYGEILTPGAKRTILFYAHYDGQPLDPKEWKSDPFQPVLRDGRDLPIPDPNAPVDPEWRLYARSASDDKAPILAIATALDALADAKIPFRSNIKFVFEGEEEAGSQHLDKILAANRDLLKSDVWLICDGPVHQTRRPQIVFGARGVETLDITLYGASRELHSGHYGNWAPNPGFALARLLTSMKSEDGKVLIDGFYADIVPLNTTEKDALAAMPNNDADLERDLQFAKPEGGGKRLIELLQYPSLNIRGLRSAYVGDQAQNVVPEKAIAAIDVRLVKGEDPDKKFEQVLKHIRKQGFFVTSADPTKEERLAHPFIARVAKDPWNYPASRTSMELLVSQTLIKVVQDATRGQTVIAPYLGGSVPMYIFENLRIPWIGVPIVNYDNHQHSSDENLRLGHLWRGMEIYAAILADLNW